MNKEQPASLAGRQPVPDKAINAIELMLDTHRLLASTAAELSMAYEDWRGDRMTDERANARLSSLCRDFAALADHLRHLSKRCLNDVSV